MRSERSSVHIPKGFTIIELLVVIAIIALLASIVLASLNESRNKAKIATTKEQLHQFQVSFELFYLNHNDYPPIPIGTDFCNMCNFWPPSVMWAHGDWENDVLRQLANDKITVPATLDPWGNPYLYDKNYNQSASGGCESYSPICSMGPDGVLETPNCQDPTQPPEVLGDDICIFLPKSSG